MPVECFKLLKPEETLLDVCLALHMSVTGSSDPLDEEAFLRLVACLELAVEKWDHSVSNTALFDIAVYNLVVSTLAEIRQRLCYSLCLTSPLVKGKLSEYFNLNREKIYTI